MSHDSPAADHVLQAVEGHCCTSVLASSVHIDNDLNQMF